MVDYAKIAKETRKTVLGMLYRAGTSHIGSNFSCIDLLTVLYEKADFKKDKLVVSKGWVAASVYALGVHHGLMPQEAIDTYCQEDSKFIGLVEPLGYWGCEFAGGSMGYGLPAGVGYALSKKLKGEEGMVYVLMSDGEMAIGTTWEAALIAGKHNLTNLVVLVDNNGFQAMGKTEDILPANFPVPDASEWWVQQIDGHNYEAIDHALAHPSTYNKVLICNTTKGKGVSFMEGDNLWHYAQIKEDDYQKALAELQ